jgi:hypothetical protein
MIPFQNRMLVDGCGLVTSHDNQLASTASIDPIARSMQHEGWLQVPVH